VAVRELFAAILERIARLCLAPGQAPPGQADGEATYVKSQAAPLLTQKVWGDTLVTGGIVLLDEATKLKQ